MDFISINILHILLRKVCNFYLYERKAIWMHVASSFYTTSF